MKLIFLDIDGTLTLPGENIPPESALKAIKAAQEKGNKVFLCTGRNPAMLSPLLQYGFDGYVASAGGYVACDSQVIVDRKMDPEAYATIDLHNRARVLRAVEVCLLSGRPFSACVGMTLSCLTGVGSAPGLCTPEDFLMLPMFLKPVCALILLLGRVEIFAVLFLLQAGRLLRARRW